MAGTLYVVATPIGNLEDITLRAVRVLRECDLIAAEDTRRTHKLLISQGLSTPCISYHLHNSRSRLPQIIERLERGLSVALVSDAGTPGISDPGLELVRACVEKGISVDPIPGASAPLTALSASGFPSEPFTFLGFAPNKSGARDRWFRRAFSIDHTFCFLEAPHRIKDALQRVCKISGERQIMLAREMTKVHQEFIRGVAADVISNIGHKIGEMTIVVAPHDERTAEPIERNDDQIYLHFLNELKSSHMDRRIALENTSFAMGMSKNEVYDIIERVKRARADSEFADD